MSRSRLATPSALARFYDTHPINAERILGRFDRSGLVSKPLTELDLAKNEADISTDQNHIGGTDFVEALAKLSRVSASTTVLDLGCGIGGSARYLASRYGCPVDGVDISRKRCADGIMLTKLVNLQNRVNIRVGDMLRMRLPLKRYDIIWGQGAWNHVSDKASFLAKWSYGLKPQGRYAFEDVYLRRDPGSKHDSRELAELVRIWRACLVGRDAWAGIFKALGFRAVFEDATVAAQSYCRDQLKQMNKSRNVPAEEKLAYLYFEKLIRRGTLGFLRVVAYKR
jgi:SAM-dependent methyltransferase